MRIILAALIAFGSSTAWAEATRTYAVRTDRLNVAQIDSILSKGVTGKRNILQNTKVIAIPGSVTCVKVEITPKDQAERDLLDAFKDAGNMTLLDLDEYVSEINPTTGELITYVKYNHISDVPAECYAVKIST